MVSEHFYYRNTKYWLYGSYTNRQEAERIRKQLKKKYRTGTFIFSTDSLIGSYPVYHLYANKVRKLWS